MKYKVLLCGKSKVIVDDFFTYLGQEYDAQTTSMRSADMMSHMKHFEPDVFLFCMHKEMDEDIHTIAELKDKFEHCSTAVVIIGNEEECKAFQKMTDDMADLVLTKPIMARKIDKEIAELMQQWKPAHENVDIEEAESKPKAAEPKIVEPEVVEPKAAETKTVEPKTADTKVVEPKTAKPAELQEVAPVKKHVLVVDDDPMMLKLIKEQLKDNYTVATAISGSIALKFLENKKTDMIILDYEMPGENGADVLKKIRDNEATSNLPVVFLTGITDREKIKKVVSFKPQGYLIKPIEREQLLQIIEKIIG